MTRCPWCNKLIWPWQDVRVIAWHQDMPRDLHVACAREFRKQAAREARG